MLFQMMDEVREYWEKTGVGPDSGQDLSDWVTQTQAGKAAFRDAINSRIKRMGVDLDSSAERQKCYFTLSLLPCLVEIYKIERVAIYLDETMVLIFNNEYRIQLSSVSDASSLLIFLKFFLLSASFAR